MRRNLVMIKGEFPHELAKPFEGMEIERQPLEPVARRSRQLGRRPGHPDDVRGEARRRGAATGSAAPPATTTAPRRSRASTAQLLQAAGVDFAILGQEETCTGDPARRAGNEYLFAMLAETNVATLNGYKEQGGMKKIVTTCPHCFNTLTNEYPDFGAKFEVVHHTDFLLGLVAEKKLVPEEAGARARSPTTTPATSAATTTSTSRRARSCRRIPGVELVEVECWNKKKGLCCGAGGAQMFMEEQNKDRVNVKRTLQLLDTGATTVASACPFCMTMLTDGLKAQTKEDEIQKLDVVELLGPVVRRQRRRRRRPRDTTAPAA